jgi:hypothetical protein
MPHLATSDTRLSLAGAARQFGAGPGAWGARPRPVIGSSCANTARTLDCAEMQLGPGGATWHAARHVGAWNRNIGMCATR